MDVSHHDYRRIADALAYLQAHADARSAASFVTPAQRTSLQRLFTLGRRQPGNASRSSPSTPNAAD
jgi:hypothetical protein